MARQRDPARDIAKQLWLASDKEMPLKDIAAKLGKTASTVRKWKSTDDWEAQKERNAPNAPKSKRSVPIEKERSLSKATQELLDDDGLTDKRKMFCLYYLQRFNATWAYQKAYKVDYTTANTNGPSLLVNTRVQEQINKLKAEMATDLRATAEDIAKEYLKQSFADIGDYVSYRSEAVPATKYGKPVLNQKGEQVFYDDNHVLPKPQDEVDTSLIKSVRIERGEFIFELYDKQVAQSNLMKYFSDNQVSQSRVAKAQADAEVSKAKASLLSGEDEDNREAKNDMYLDGLKELLGDDNSENEGTETDNAEHNADS